MRFRAPATPPEFKDVVYGKVGSGKVNRNIGQAYDDLILLKTDGWPTYHLANVVDDHLMEVTHVVRGTEWMISTPKHIALYDAFGWTPPAFAHVGLLQDAEGHKLSKRRGDIDIASFRERGILPEALANFLALLGWSGHGGGDEFMPMEKLKSIFNMKWTKGNATVDMGKLDFLQKHHALARISAGGPPFDELVAAIEDQVRKTDFPELDSILHERSLSTYVASILRADAKNYLTPSEFVASNSYFFSSFPFSRDAVRQIVHDSPHGTIDVLKQLQYHLEELSAVDWAREHLKEALESAVGDLAKRIVAEAHDDTLDEKAARRAASKTIYQAMRNALTDGKHGAPIPDTIEILGQHVALERLAEWLHMAEDEGRAGLDFSME